jgi:enoyl-[acyl-carrier protein] reductase II
MMTYLCQMLDIEYPIIQAPMDWITNGEMVAAVSDVGALGVLGPNAGQRTVTTSVTETGERLRREIRKVRALTEKPFGVNLISMKSTDIFPEDAYSDECHRVVVEEGVPVAVLVGDAPERYTRSLHAAGIRVLHRPIFMTREAALEAEEAGVDALIVVGCEGGGHPGSAGETSSVLVPYMVDLVHIPVVAGGGIGDGRGVAAALTWGAEAAYLGTRFIAATECGAHENVKRAIVQAGEASTVLLPSSLGGLRALKNPVTERCQEMQANGCPAAEITETYHSGYMKGMLEGDLEEGTLVCGAACALVKRVERTSEIVLELVGQMVHSLSTWH